MASLTESILIYHFPIASALRSLIYRWRFMLRHGVGGDVSGPLRPSAALARGRNPSARRPAFSKLGAATAMGVASPPLASGSALTLRKLTRGLCYQLVHRPPRQQILWKSSTSMN